MSMDESFLCYEFQTGLLQDLSFAPKQGDFGLAVPADDVAAVMNMGPPGYIAPEVLADFESASAASDVFSNGMILHELLSGIVPTGEDNPNLELIPNLRGLRPLVSKSIAQHPRRRYADGGAIAKELRTWHREAKKFPPHLLTNSPARVSSLTPRAPRLAPIASASPANRLALPLGGLAVIDSNRSSRFAVSTSLIFSMPGQSPGPGPEPPPAGLRAP